MGLCALGVVGLGATGYILLTPASLQTSWADTPADTPSPDATALPGGGGVPVDEARETDEPAAPATVSPFVTSAILTTDLQYVIVHAFVPGLTEEGGTCTATVTGPEGDHAQTSAAYIEVATTTCNTLAVDLLGTTADGLQVSVTYTSSTSAGTTSEPTKVTQ